MRRGEAFGLSYAQVAHPKRSLGQSLHTPQWVVGSPPGMLRPYRDYLNIMQTRDGLKARSP
jgi:hypothetical protein